MGEVYLGERQHLIHLPHGWIVMSYLRSDGERSIRASYGFISFFESRIPFSGLTESVALRDK